MNRTRPFLNKHTMQKQLQIVDAYHSLNMKLIKPITSKLMEHSDHITINNTKREKLKETRQLEIERDNKILLNKISAVMNKEGSYSMSKTMNFRTKINKSLNLTERKKQDKHISEQNKRFLSRLQHKKPTMDLQRLHKDWCDNKEVIKRMSNRDFYLTTLRSQDNYRYTSANEKFARGKIEASKINRICVIDGCKMKIKIKFVGGFLNITTDCLNNSNLKQISISKDEAIYFIQQECNGKMEQLIDKLKYDHKNDALFLVSDNLAEVSDQDLHYYNPQTERAKQNRFLDVQVKQKKNDKNDRRIKDKNPISLSSISEQRVTNLHVDPQPALNAPLQLMEETIKYSPLVQNEEYSELIGFQEHNQTFNQSLSFDNIVSNQILEEEPTNASKRMEQKTGEILVQPQQMEDYNQIIHIPESTQPARGKAHSLINDQSTH